MPWHAGQSDCREALTNLIEKEFVSARTDENPVRVWIPGCATGEEAYSLAILLREIAERCQRHLSFKILATDLDGLNCR
jgi:two-component system CheB/CheR fusion protein